VERFSRAHERHELPDKAKHYRNLLPATAPADGQQYAFEVDLDKCSGCKACVTACHSLNGLDDNETWRGVGLLISPANPPLPDGRLSLRVSPPASQQHVTTACHHCVDPGCLNGCPVLAYDKDPVTGIVRHLDDQCIGCQYCVMKCPYEVPQYSAARGIVRKCDMCSSRLAVGEAPACVQACPNEAIRISLVDQREMSLAFRVYTTNANSFLPASPDAAITIPTTRFVSKRPLPENLLAGDDASVRPAQAHLPLTFLLVLTQLAVGTSVAAMFLKSPAPLPLVAFLAGALGLVTGALHLGQPLKAWRAFLGWRKSWFSREVIIFGAFVPLAFSAWGAGILSARIAALQPGLAAAAAVTGVLGVFCSAMIYADTRREFWSAGQSLAKFFGTTLLLGGIAVIAFTGSSSVMLCALVGVVTSIKLAFEHRIFRHRINDEAPGQSPLSKTARLLTGELARFTRVRIACGLLGGIALPGVILIGGASTLSLVAFALCLLGELIERHLFFTAVATRKMPGALKA
jgi:Fe-S-cluster-containing dehydrogenase component/DMSO reductase anchor subunit